MGNRGRGSGSGAGGGGPQMQFSMMAPMTPVVKSLIIANVAIWLVLQLVISMIAERFFSIDLNLTYLFGLVPNNVIFKFFVWEPITYMFLHSSNPFHILFNMLLLWWLGGELEQRWGSRFFLLYYMVSGVGAGVLYAAAVALHGWVFSSLTPAWTIPVVGASGAIFGLMLAYGLIFGERVVYFMMLFPMRAKYFVMILGAVEVVTLLNNGIGGGDVANLAHVGGLLSGFLFLRFYTAFQQRRWRKGGGGAKARGRGLKLVVNNDNKKDDKGGGPPNDKGGGPPNDKGGGPPRYWN